MNLPPATHPIWKTVERFGKFALLAGIVYLTSHQFSADEMALLVSYLFVELGAGGIRSRAVKKAKSKETA